MPLSTGSKAKLNSLYPPLASAMLKLAEMAEGEGIIIIITQALRTWAEQDKLYAKGRTEPPIGPQHFVTKAKGGSSFHNFTLAADIAVMDGDVVNWDADDPRYKRCGEIGRSLGLEWGGDWKGFRDVPHFQWATKLSLGECRQLFLDGGLSAVLDEVAKADSPSSAT